MPVDDGAAPAAVTEPTRRRLGALVFTAGAGTLATEIAASRLLAPYFGSSTVVWANIIGLILAYLSLGYWLGGRLADRRPDPRLLGTLMLVASAFVAATPFGARPILDAAVRGLDAVSLGAVVGSFFAALALFAVPVTLLGAVSPFAIRLALADVAEAGSVAGRLYALSTAGSIAGTFVSAIVAIPLVGTQRTMLGSAALLAGGAALLLGARFLVVALALATLVAIPPGTVKAAAGLLWEGESAYQYIQVVRRADGSRALFLNEGVAMHSLWYRDSVLTGGEWDMFLVVPPLPDRPVRNVLVIGNAAGTTARAYRALYPSVAVDAVEIDPKVTAVGRRFFGLRETPRLHVVTADGRPFLAGTSRRWDAILVDAYRQPYIPFYLATEEFFRLARAHLRPGGAIALNVAALPGDDRLAERIAGTVASVFPQAWAWRPLRFNELVLGLDRAVSGRQLEARVAGASPEVASLVPLFRAELRSVRPAEDPLTDDRAPVELVTDRMLVRYVAEGGSLDEQPLPTAP